MFESLKRKIRCQGYRAKIELLACPGGLKTGERATLTVRLSNQGAKAWSSDDGYPVYLAYHWWDEQPLVFDGERTILPRPVAPGESCEVQMQVLPPNSVGRFLLELDLVREGACWFADSESPTLRHPLRVERGEAPTWDGYRHLWSEMDLAQNYWSPTGPGTREEFEAIGEKNLEFLREKGFITPSGRVLDVGCGAGSMARVLLGYLDSTGRYVGTDIAPEAIEFCRKRYRDSRFEFFVNEPEGVSLGGGEFDLVTLFSVLTHLFPDEIATMLSSINPLLAPGGRVLADVFLNVEDVPDSGTWAKVNLNEASLISAAETAGLRLERMLQIADEGDTRRFFYTFWRDGSVGVVLASSP